MRRVLANDEQGFTLVELLVVIVLLAIIGTATTGVVVSTLRTEAFQKEMQAVMDDGRLSLRSIRREVRAARQIFETSCQSTTACTPSSRLQFWVDQNQDTARTPDEIVCYFTQSIGPSQFELVRWTQATPGAGLGCDTASRPPSPQVIARTLVPNLDTTGNGVLDTAAPFIEMTPNPPGDPSAPQTRNIHVVLRLQLQTARNQFGAIELETIVRLRNVA